ncbi:MAG: hypothetical protein NVS3B14_19010 [Ktedonobacteraceae bacterium]
MLRPEERGASMNARSSIKKTKGTTRQSIDSQSGVEVGGRVLTCTWLLTSKGMSVASPVAGSIA